MVWVGKWPVLLLSKNELTPAILAIALAISTPQVKARDWLSKTFLLTQLDALQVVPEPSAIGGLAVFGLLAYRLKQRKG
jgi:hypothetical protein